MSYYGNYDLCSLSLSSSVLAYVLQVKVEMELEIQQCEKTKAVREEQLERLTQICQEQAVGTNTTESENQTALQEKGVDHHT